MNLIDGLVTAYVGYGVVRGRARGLAEEAYRLLRVGVALFAGCGLYGVVSELIGKLIYLGPALSGPVSFVATMLGTWSALRVLRKKFVTLLETKYARLAEVGGAIAGGLRAAVLASGAMITAHLAGRDGVMADSWLGKLISAWAGN